MRISQEGVNVSPEDVDGFISVFKKWFVELKENFYIPKKKKNKIGIIIALNTENNKEEIKLQNHLIRELNNFLNNSTEKNKFHIISLPSRIVNKIQNHETALKYLKKANGHLIIHGGFYQGNIKGSAKYIFKLRGVVRHFPIPKLMRESFSKEFTNVLPEKIILDVKDDLEGFEFTEKWIGYVIRYITAIAAFVSMDFNLAKNLFFELKEEIEHIKEGGDIPIIYYLKKNLDLRIIELMVGYLDINYLAFASTRDMQYILDNQEYLNILADLDPENYRGHLNRSILHFFNNDIESAILELEGLENSDLTWRYSLGFLTAFQGNIDGALEHYKKVIHKNPSCNILDVEIFISEALNNNPDKTQLIFFRGLINFKVKGDNQLAKKDFELFLSKKTNFERLNELAQKYLEQIEKI